MRNMKVTKDCYDCVQRLIYQAASLATEDMEVRQKAIDNGLKVLEENFPGDGVSIVIATKIHKVIREVTQNPDPYREMKEEEIALAKQLYQEVNPAYGEDFRDCLKLAALGNTIDFFRPYDAIAEDMRKPVNFTVDDSAEIETLVEQGGRLLYLADNAGEVFFDLPLIKWMRQFAEVTYVVKASPVQDDATVEDIKRAGMETEIGRVITTGTATPGIDFSLASPQFKCEYENADLIFAKGMGYYESLSELPAAGRVFHCFMIKCKPVADSLGVLLNSYIAMLR
jgi:hypothetical protein